MADDDQIEVEFPGAARGPVRHVASRVAPPFGLVMFVALLTYIGRDGCIPEDDSVSLLDAFYYSTVSITTTAFGDIRPS